MDPIKEAFSKIKEDILSLKEELSSIKLQLIDLSHERDLQQTTPTHNPSEEAYSTNQQTNNQTTPTHNSVLEDLYAQNTLVSIGNRGVPTNKPTNQQTNKQTPKTSQSSLQVERSSHNPSNHTSSSPPFPPATLSQKDPISEFKRANEILSSLDDIKKEIRLKFKDLTPQEMLVFSTLYALEEQNIDQITYKLIASNLHLSESSIRDYINKLAKKGVPIERIRQNNKTILLKISSDLKNIASLTTIQRLREL